MSMPDKNASYSGVRRLCFDAVFLCCALALSYLEAVLPISSFLPFPGMKLGLSNCAVTLAFFLVSPLDAALVSFCRIALSALLFGNAAGFAFSLSGGFFAFAVLALTALSPAADKMSFFGLSVLCAAAHNFGQILAAAFMFGSSAIFAYLPALFCASVVFGGAVGIILNALYPRLFRLRRKI